MKASSISEIKKELQELDAKHLAELCLNLARYKKDNKEYLGYLLFEAHNKAGFLNDIKQEVDDLFTDINTGNNLYYIKKSLRKIIRLILKYCRYLDNKALAAELHIYFCQKLIRSNIPFKKSQLLVNLFNQEIKRIQSLIATLHEDLQGDYQRELEQLITG